MKGMEPIQNMARQVSIVLICYNYGRYLDCALDSVFSQTIPVGEVLLIDDGSTDDTHAVASKYEGRVRYINQGHHGVCFSRNLGLSAATGKWIIFLDADDALDPFYVEKTLQVWREQAPGLSFVYTQRRDLRDPHLISSFPEFSIAELKKKNFIMVSALMDRMRARSIGYDPAFRNGLEDYDFFLTMAERGGVGCLLNEPLLQVRMHPETRSVQCGAPAIRWNLLGHLLRKHKHFFSLEERRYFLQGRRDYVKHAVEIRRKSYLSTGERLMDLLYLVKARASLFQLCFQILYLLSPSVYHLMMSKMQQNRVAKRE